MISRFLLPFFIAAVSGAALFSQPYGPLQNARIEAYDHGVVFFFDYPEGYDPFNSDPKIANYQFRRDGGDPVPTYTRIDAPLEPATTYNYQLFGVDSGGTVITAITEISATTLPDGSGLTTSRVSLQPDGNERAYDSTWPAVSGDGRYVAYASYGTQGTPNQGDVQIHRLDRQTGETIVVSKNADGTFADQNCTFPSISDDGRFIAFSTTAKNLSLDDTDFGNDVYLYDAQTGLVTLVSDAPGVGSDNDNNSQYPVPPILSADGSTVAFISNATNLNAEATVRRDRLYLYNVLTTELTLAPDPVYSLSGYTTPGNVEQVALSRDGDLAVFTVAYKPTNGFSDTLRVIWLLDRSAGAPGTISAITRQYGNGQPATGFAYAPTISRDGRWVAFSWKQSFSLYHNIADPSLGGSPNAQVGYLLDRQNDTLEVFTRGAAGNMPVTAITTHQARISISDDGQRIAFQSTNGGANPLAVYDPTADINVYVRDRSLGRTFLVNRSSTGVFSEASRPATLAQLTADGRAVVYQSKSANLVTDDTNARSDIFLTELDLAPPDTDAPTWPNDATLEATTIGATLVDLAWSEAVDAGGAVTAYRVFGDDEILAETGATVRTLQVPALTPETTYTFRVEALDATGNISTTGPTLEVTTKPSVAGSAALSAPSLDGGRVQLAWDPAEEAILGYVVQRREAGGEWTDVGEVGPTVNTYLDTGLPASAALSYRILLKPTAGDPLPHSATVSITTKALSIQSVATTPALAANSRELLAIEGSLAVSMTAESGRTASATVAYERWVDLLDPSKGTESSSASASLTESGTTAGLFTGAWTLPAGTARVTSVSGVLADGFGATTSLPASGFPRTVEAALAISVNASTEDFAKGLVFSLWSESIRAGASRAITGSGTLENGGLPPGTDYRLRVLQGNRVVQSLTAVTLRAGLLTTVDQSLEATTPAFFTVKDPDGNPRGGFLIGLYETDTDRFLGFGEVSGSGTVDAAPGLQFAPGTEVSYRLTRQPWDIDAGPHTAIVPDAGTVGDLTLEWSEYFVRAGSITGTLLDPSGSPVANGTLTGYSANEGVNGSQSSETDTDGSFSLEAFATTFVTARARLSDPATGRMTRGEASLTLTIPAEGGTVDAGEVTLQPVYRYRFVVRSLALRHPDGTLEEVDLSSDPRMGFIRMSVIRPGFLRSDARSSGSTGGLFLETEYAVGTEYLLTLDPGPLGYRKVEIRGTTEAGPGYSEDSVVINLDPIELDFASDHYVTAILAESDGTPLPAGTVWRADLPREISGEFFSGPYVGLGSSVLLPTALQTGTLEIWLPDDPSERAMQLFEPRAGANDLGSIRFPAVGRIRSSRATYLNTFPELLEPTQSLWLSAGMLNAFNTPLSDVVLTIHLPPGVNPEPDSLVIDSLPASGTLSGGDYIVVLPDLDPGKWTKLYTTFALSPDFTGETVDLTATLSYTGPEGSSEEMLFDDPVVLIRRPTIDGPEQVRERTLKLTGRAPPGSLRLEADGDVVGKTYVSRQGYWQMWINLPERPVPYWHTLTAVSTLSNGSEVISNPHQVLHQPNPVGVTQVRMRQPPTVQNSEALSLLRRFPDVVEWTTWQTTDDGPVFWRRILAGFPFEFELDFNQPDFVSDIDVTVAGGAGGTARATRGDDGRFRALIESDRSNSWQAGPISVEYRTPATAFPKWGNHLRIGAIEDLPPGSEAQALTEDTPPPAEPAAFEDSDYTQGHRFTADFGDGALTGTVSYRITPVADPPESDTVEVDFPGGSIDYPATQVPFKAGSVDYSLSGSDFTFTVTMLIDVDRLAGRDAIPPSWVDGAGISLTDIGADRVTLNWPQARDDLWVQDYQLTVNDTNLAEFPGGLKSHVLTDLTPGMTYEVSLTPIDAVGKSGSPLQLILDFNGTDTLHTTPVTIAAGEPDDFPGSILPPGFELDLGGFPNLNGKRTLETQIKWAGRVGAAGDLLNLLSDYYDAYQQVDRWKEMLDAVDNCGASPTDYNFLRDRINDAANAVLTKNVLSTTMMSGALAISATGAGAGVGAMVGLISLGGSLIADDIAENKIKAAEDAFAGINSFYEDCQDPNPPDGPGGSGGSSGSGGRIKQPLARPTWKIDPSGFVYEVTEDNRLEGVTATLLQGETENGPWMVSAAEEFGEINPQVTPVGGTYRWDVPAGWWQVMYQKDGYETAFSEVLPVPPPHFDVNIPLKSLAPPEVNGVTSLNNGAALRIDFANYIRATMAGPATIRLRDDGGNLLDGQVYAPADDLLDNPHTESTAKDISKRILFVPSGKLTIGSTYTVEVDGVIESYGEIPMGETAAIEITITDDTSGTWFGSFSPGGGLWTMNVAGDGTASLSGYDPATGKQVDATGTVDSEGNLSIDVSTLAGGAVLTGSLTDGSLTGSVSVLGYTASGARSQGESASEAIALTYHGAVIGSAGTTVSATVGPDGTVFVVIDGELMATATTGMLDEQDHFSGLLSDGSELELDLSDPEGTMSGVLSLVDNGSWSILGAEQSLPSARLVNVSGRGPIGAGGSLIAGFVIRGSAENPMLIRAIGPGLETFGVEGRLERPRIRLVDQSKPADTNRIAENTNWLEAGNRNELRAVFAGLGAFFLEDAKADATVYLPVTPGPYTAVVQGLDGLTGITLVEAYDADLGVFGTTSQGVANLSLRGQVGTGSGVMIAGFVIEGNAPRRVLFRGIGPGLGTVGVANFLPDPEITLFDGPSPIAENQSWGTDLPDEGLAEIFETVGAFPLESGSADAALVIWLAPGPYTVRLRNEVVGEGTGLIEIYDLP
ncbi:MAG: hypothetical protein R3F07_13875 [Opitutaceae bacterium]